MDSRRRYPRAGQPISKGEKAAAALVVVWFALCAAVGIAFVVLLFWLGVEAIQWLGRH